MVGPDAAEIMQGMAVALKMGVTKAQLDTVVGIHPSAAEEFVTMRTITRQIRDKVRLLKPQSHAMLCHFSHIRTFFCC